MNPVKAMLYEKDAQDRKVAFQFNPTAVAISHGCTLREIGIGKANRNDINGTTERAGSKFLSVQDNLEKLGFTTFRIGNLVFDGYPGAIDSCGQLLNWSYAFNEGGVNRMTALIFSWGLFQLGSNTTTRIEVSMTRAEVVYERFTPKGAPTRAKVSLDLRATADNPLRQNPTSGGVDLRSGHTVVNGDTLAGIAGRAYGSPSQWRRLARVNGIEDPLRIRPGDQVAVPSRDDVQAAAR
ncbi:MAG: Peptidoglycan-binding LysM [Pseudonocardiales bacterium]|nr:Peptidoglycan-binding LysM [Pseudonocardiales bacterium]